MTFYINDQKNITVCKIYHIVMFFDYIHCLIKGFEQSDVLPG